VILLGKNTKPRQKILVAFGALHPAADYRLSVTKCNYWAKSLQPTFVSLPILAAASPFPHIMNRYG
jgi:hypothetical protein